MKRINNILILDDRNYVIGSENDLIDFKLVICNALKKKKYFVDDNVEIKKFGWSSSEQNNTNQVVLNETESQHLPWLTSLLDEVCNKNTIIFCDYDWSETNGEISARDIYTTIKDEENVIFIFYSTIAYEEAQDEVDLLMKQEHSCKLISEVMTSANDFTEFVQSAEEAINEWKEL